MYKYNQSVIDLISLNWARSLACIQTLRGWFLDVVFLVGNSGFSTTGGGVYGIIRWLGWGDEMVLGGG